MKFSPIFLAGLALLAQTTIAVPTPTVEETGLIVKPAKIGKRASITDVATTGYASTNGGTSGGKGGSTTTVSTLAQFTAAVTDDTVARVIIISGTITGNQQIRVGSNKSLIGLPGARLVNIGLFVWKQTNVIVRNIISQSVRAANGDGIGIQASTNVWVDHCEFYSDPTSDKDYYDGLVDITHASEWVTISHCYLHDHWKASLIGHSDNNGAEDTGHLHVTQHDNHWARVNSRTPSFRFGTGHVFNSYFEDGSTGIDARDAAQLLVQSSAWRNVSQPIAALYSSSPGYVLPQDLDLGGAQNTAPLGSLAPATIPYAYSLVGSANVQAAVVGVAGATLTW